MRGQGKHVKRSVWIGQSRLMSLLLLYKSKTNCLAFHSNSCRHQASAVSEFLKIPNIIPACLYAQWRWLISMAHFALWDFKSVLQLSQPGALVGYITLALIWKAKQPRSWITFHSTQVKCSTGVTQVNERVTRNVILDTQSCNQQLNVQNSPGWNNTHTGFIFHRQDGSFINFSAECFLLHLTRLMTLAALKSFLLWGLGITLNQCVRGDLQPSLLTKKTAGLSTGDAWPVLW